MTRREFGRWPVTPVLFTGTHLRTSHIFYPLTRACPVPAGSVDIMKSLFFLTMIFAGVLPAQNTPATDALDALRGLKSITEVGVSYRDYMPRVLDAKIKVDKYLAGAAKDDPTAKRVTTIMQMYIIAAKGWGADITKDYGAQQKAAESVAGNPEIMACPAMPIEKPHKPDPAEAAEAAKVMAEAAAVLAEAEAMDKRTPEEKAAAKAEAKSWAEKQTEKDRSDRERRKNIDVTKLVSNPDILWRCASEKIAMVK